VTPDEKHASPTSARLLLEKLKDQREVDIGKLDIEWLERLYALLDIARELVSLIGVLLFVSVVLIIGNTIRLNILSKREEILVMKLVGATDAFIHRPFLYTGFWYGLLGGLIAWFAVIIILWWMDSSSGICDALSERIQYYRSVRYCLTDDAGFVDSVGFTGVTDVSTAACQRD